MLSFYFLEGVLDCGERRVMWCMLGVLKSFVFLGCIYGVFLWIRFSFFWIGYFFYGFYEFFWVCCILFFKELLLVVVYICLYMFLLIYLNYEVLFFK